jgi:phage protein D
MIDFAVETTTLRSKGRVRLSGRDPVTKKSFTIDATEESAEPETLSSVREVVDSKTGITGVTAVVRERVRATSARSEGEARHHAHAAYRRSNQNAHTLRATVVGDPSLTAKRVYTFEGMGKFLSGNWYAKRARHRVEPGSWTVELECQRAHHGGHKQGTGEVKTTGQINTQKPHDGLRQVEVIDQITGESRTEWRR